MAKTFDVNQFNGAVMITDRFRNSCYYDCGQHVAECLPRQSNGRDCIHSKCTETERQKKEVQNAIENIENVCHKRSDVDNMSLSTANINIFTNQLFSVIQHTNAKILGIVSYGQNQWGIKHNLISRSFNGAMEKCEKINDNNHEWKCRQDDAFTRSLGENFDRVSSLTNMHPSLSKDGRDAFLTISDLTRDCVGYQTQIAESTSCQMDSETRKSDSNAHCHLALLDCQANLKSCQVTLHPVDDRLLKVDNLPLKLVSSASQAHESNFKRTKSCSQTDMNTMTTGVPCERSLSNAKDSVIEDGIYCRICHSKTDVDDLVSPCLCTGSLQFVHETCLLNWFKSSIKTKCELCLHEVPVKKMLKPFSEV